MALVQQDLGHHDPEPVLAGLQPAGGDYRGGLCRPVRRHQHQQDAGGQMDDPELDRRPVQRPEGELEPAEQREHPHAALANALAKLVPTLL